MNPAKTILVGVDQSMSNRRACDYACDVAEALDARLVLAQVIEPVPHIIPENVLRSITEVAERDLAARATELRPYVKSVDIEVGHGEPWDGLATLASKHDASLVIVGTAGRRGVTRAFLGSVAEKVIRTCPRPVVTVPGHAFVNRAQAGHRLAVAIARMSCTAPTVVALSRGALPVAVEVARAVDAPLDLWLTQPIVLERKTIGVVGEDGRSTFGEAARDTSSAERECAEKEAFSLLSREMDRLRGVVPMGEVWERTVILVSDGIDAPASFLLATHVMRELGALQVIAAAPVLPRSALAAISRDVDAVAYVDAAVVANTLACWYRHPAPPTTRIAKALLADYSPSGGATRAAS